MPTRHREVVVGTVKLANLAGRRGLRRRCSGHREPKHHVGAGRLGHIRSRAPTPPASEALGGPGGVGRCQSLMGPLPEIVTFSKNPHLSFLLRHSAPERRMTSLDSRILLLRANAPVVNL
jgi:hypothetical protein